MARRNDHSREQIRDMALAETERILSEEGLAGVSARRVATGIGYTVGTLYLVFRNLDDLLLQANTRTLDQLHAEMREALAACEAPDQAILTLALAYVDYATANTERWMAIYDHRLNDEKSVPDWFRAKVVASLSVVEDALAPLAGHADAAEVGQAARALWGAVHGICVLGLTGKLDLAGKTAVEPLVRILIDDFLRGFGER